MLEKSNPGSLTLSTAKLARLGHLRRLSHLWDESLRVPGTKYRVGLESLVGFLPLGGDVIGILLSCYILFQAIQFRLPKTILLKMALNIVIDGLIGTIPILGDLFDTTWKANTKNVNLLEAHLHHPQSSHQASRSFLILFGTGLILTIAMLATISIIFVKSLFNIAS